MKYSIVVLGAPGNSQSPQTAFKFATAAISRGHSIYRVFFYHDGVHNGSTLNTPPQDEINIPSEWQQFGEAQQIDMVVCIASALRRGIINSEEANRFNRQTSNLNERAFDLSGLGQLVDATVNSDRVITFGC